MCSYTLLCQCLSPSHHLSTLLFRLISLHPLQLIILTWKFIVMEYFQILKVFDWRATLMEIKNVQVFARIWYWIQNHWCISVSFPFLFFPPPLSWQLVLSLPLICSAWNAFQPFQLHPSHVQYADKDWTNKECVPWSSRSFHHLFKPPWTTLYLVIQHYVAKLCHHGYFRGYHNHVYFPSLEFSCE